MTDDTMLFKSPGPHNFHDGWFDFIIVDAMVDGAIDAAIKDGWHLTTCEAKKAVEPVEQSKAKQAKVDNPKR